MKATLSEDEYRELKDFLGFYSSHYMPTDLLPPDLRPIVGEAPELKGYFEGERGLATSGE